MPQRLTSSPLTDRLNAHQQLAVTAKENHMLILAGAGSGKTRVLVHRIAWLIDTLHLSPHAILAVTFTNKAASEMRGRIDKLLPFSTGGMWIGTFHSLSHRLLRQHWSEAGLIQNFQVMDSDDQLRLIRQVLKNLSMDENRWPPKQIQSYINNQKDAGKRPHHIETSRDPYQKSLVQVYQAYEEACHRTGMLDFAELLLRCYELLNTTPTLLQHYQQRFKHILIDEFQDTNTIQYAWIKLLAGNGSYVMCVGDDDQSIYGWRGAKVENIQGFLDDFPNTELIRLEQNYRSTSNILAGANALISKNTDRLGKNLWTEGHEGEPISVYAGFNDLDESRFIVTQIQDWMQKGNQYSDVAILYRSNAQSRVLEEALLHASIPYRIYGGLRYFERAEIKDALAYLRLLSNRHDDAALERVINMPTRGIGDKTLVSLRELAEKERCSLWHSSELLLSQQSLSARAANALQHFLDLITELDTASRDLELHERTEKVLYGSGLYDHYLKNKNENAETKIENLKELISAAKQFSLEHRTETESSPEELLSAFLSHAVLESGDPEEKGLVDCVQMMTLHTAKGLEFPLVFISGLEEGLFPHRMSVEDGKRLPEERRLCYVGMTRAMKKLYLTYAEIRRLHGKEEYHRPSRFIRELPQETLNHIRMAHKVSRPNPSYGSLTFSHQTSRSLAKSSQNQTIPNTIYELGQRVRHPVYGEGIIINYEGRGEHTRVQVKFSQHDIKWLVLAYAKLEV